jgi:hypothetical protein
MVDIVTSSDAKGTGWRLRHGLSAIRARAHSEVGKSEADSDCGVFSDSNIVVLCKVPLNQFK